MEQKKLGMVKLFKIADYIFIASLSMEVYTSSKVFCNVPTFIDSNSSLKNNNEWEQLERKQVFIKFTRTNYE